MKNHHIIKKAKDIKNRYEHLVLPAALLGGFVIDTFTLNQIDQVFDNLLLIIHILIVGTTIGLLFSKGTHFGNKFLNEKRERFLQTLMAFSFGALFSGFVIFYTRSGSLLVSWPFILTMLVLMLGTEFRKHYFHKRVLQIVVYYLALLAWANFFVPVVIKKIGPGIFILSTVISTVLIFLFIETLRLINKAQIRTYEKAIMARIFILFILFNVLYFTRIIPPVPLSLKYKAVYYDIERIDGGYKAQYEKSTWLNIFNKRSRVMYWQQGEDLYVFTQIFAPTKIGTHIRHVWERYDEQARKWVTSDDISIPITGGRKNGYRIFSKKQNLSYTRWRVKTVTEQGQTLGIISFKVIPFQDRTRDLVTEEL